MYLVRTKASELADFPGVNTPYNQVKSSFNVIALHVGMGIVKVLTVLLLLSILLIDPVL